jgi:tetratricopeptide (TPR) repeat protein
MAIELSPGYPTGHQLYAEYLRDLGCFDEAMREIQKAQELDPLSPYYELAEGTILLATRRPADAIPRFERALQKQPNFPAVHVFHAMAYLHDGQYETALAMVEAADPQGLIPDVLSLRGCALAKLGRIEETQRVLAQLERLSEKRYVAPFHAALVHVSLGQWERALDLLEQTAEERNWFVRIFPLAPDFDPLRSHPRFIAIMKKIGLDKWPRPPAG